MGIWKSLKKGLDSAVIQANSTKGFEDGMNGRPPWVTLFGHEDYREAYNNGYKQGQEAAKTRLMATANDKLREL